MPQAGCCSGHSCQLCGEWPTSAEISHTHFTTAYIQHHSTHTTYNITPYPTTPHIYNIMAHTPIKPLYHAAAATHAQNHATHTHSTPYPTIPPSHTHTTSYHTIPEAPGIYTIPPQIHTHHNIARTHNITPQQSSYTHITAYHTPTQHHPIPCRSHTHNHRSPPHTRSTHMCNSSLNRLSSSHPTPAPVTHRHQGKRRESTWP